MLVLILLNWIIIMENVISFYDSSHIVHRVTDVRYDSIVSADNPLRSFMNRM